MFHNAIRAYGPDAFEWLVLQECFGDESLLVAEIEWIQRLNCRSPHGYNLTGGGDGALMLDEECRRRKAEAARLRFSSPEWREAHSKRLTGIKKSPEARMRMSAAAMGKVISEHQRLKAAENTRRQFTNQEHREAHAKRIRAAWADPEKRARMLANRSRA